MSNFIPVSSGVEAMQATDTIVQTENGGALSTSYATKLDLTGKGVFFGGIFDCATSYIIAKVTIDTTKTITYTQNNGQQGVLTIPAIYFKSSLKIEIKVGVGTPNGSWSMSHKML